MANVLASVAQYETEVRAERVKAGQAAAKAKGKTWGGNVKGRYWKVKPGQEEAIMKMMAEGKAIIAIARTTAQSRPTIYRGPGNHAEQEA